MALALGVGTVLFAVACTVAGQLTIKSQLQAVGGIPPEAAAWPNYFWHLLTSWGGIVGLGLAFLAALAYMGAISRLNVTYLDPFAGPSFPLILTLGGLIFDESITWQKLVSSALIVIGVFVGSMSEE